jgi:Acyl-CoA carboxylase epsilon subunit
VTELRVVRGGTPTDEELAALVTALAARAAAAAATESTSLRQPLSPWVASGLVKGTRTSA